MSNDLDRAAELADGRDRAKRLQRGKSAIEAFCELEDLVAKCGKDIQALNIRWSPMGDGVLLVLKATDGNGQWVAFEGGSSTLDAIYKLSVDLKADTIRWKTEKPWSGGQPGG